MREMLCTTCCRVKRDDRELLPAAQRYRSPRIAWVIEEGERRGLPVAILSGRFGLLSSEDPIPSYDQPLTSERVPGMLATVREQLARRAVHRLVLFARPRDTPGWSPYYETIERACRAEGVELVLETVGPEVPEEPPQG